VRAPKRRSGCARCGGGDHDISAVRGLDLVSRPRAHLEPGVRRGQRLRALADGGRTGSRARAREDLLRQLQVHAALAAAAEDAERLDRPLGERADAEHAGAAVRISVIQVASMTASGAPVPGVGEHEQPWM
jgi:hypothetical protein